MSTSKFYQSVLSYEGTGFYGWQKQPDQNQTIQGQLEKALEKISKSKEVHTIGSGRTDAGVHALGQVVRIEIPLEIDPSSLTKALNSKLPASIKVLETHLSSETFNPVFDAISKEYRYFFTNEDLPPHLRNTVTRIKGDLDFELLETAWSQFIGSHDFQNFFTVGTPVKSTVREVFDAELLKIQSGDQWSSACAPYYCLRVKGSGFLKQMVRLMVGSAWSVAKSKVSLIELAEALNTPLENKLGAVAPAEGLFLWNVQYPQ